MGERLEYMSPKRLRQVVNRNYCILLLVGISGGLGLGTFISDTVKEAYRAVAGAFSVPEPAEKKPKEKTIEKKVVKAKPPEPKKPEPFLSPAPQPLEKIVEPEPIPATVSYDLKLTERNVISDGYQAWKVPTRIEDYVAILQVNYGISQDEHLKLFRESAKLAKSENLTDIVHAYYGFQYIFHQRDDSNLPVSYKMRSSYMRSKLALDMADHYQENGNKIIASRLIKLASRLAHIHKKFYPKFKFNQKLEDEIAKRR